MSKEFTYKVVKHIATIGKSDTGNFATELNLISYNGAAPKWDLRKWNKKTDEMMKGITLTNDELHSLSDVLNKLKGELHD